VRIEVHRRAALEKLAEQAAKLGWTRREAEGGFARKPDAFAALPKPPAATKK
jgi:hypothetical protein